MVPLNLFSVWGIAVGKGNGFVPLMPEGQSFVDSLELGLAIMMWMYSGRESMSTLAGEIQNPQKVIPKALLIGTPLVIATYFISVYAIIRVARIDGTDNWMNMRTGGGVDFVVAAKMIGGTAFEPLLLLSAILSNIGQYAGYVAMGSRPQFQMSRERRLPRFLGKMHRSWGYAVGSDPPHGRRQRGAH